MNPRRWTHAVFLAGTLTLLGGCDREPRLQPAAGAGNDLDRSRRTALVTAVEQVTPSVVGIYALTPQVSGQGQLRWEFFRQFFPNLPQFQNRYIPQLGSGIVLDSSGYFLTNDHLVGRAEQIWVILSDGREIAAQVVGTDPSYDLAVIRVSEQENPGTYQTAPLGKAEELMIGEWVVALGNPYGLYLEDPRPSVTAGVVSALHRDIKLGEGSPVYKDMIQTDAAINPGNSGGPLANAAGEVVGINTFIFTQGGGSLGIGFAIPIEIAIDVAEELILYGQVRGRWIGIAVKNLTAALAAQLGTSSPNGLVVWSLERGSPADRAGVQLGDIIRQVNGEMVSDPIEARRSIFAARVGDTVNLGIERNNEMINIPVTLEPLPVGREGGGGE